MKEFLALYPDHGPDAGTGPRSRREQHLRLDEIRCATCDHTYGAHNAALGACTVVRHDDTRISGSYCPCRDYRQVQPK